MCLKNHMDMWNNTIDVRYVKKTEFRVFQRKSAIVSTIICRNWLHQARTASSFQRFIQRRGRKSWERATVTNAKKAGMNTGFSPVQA